MGIKIKNRDPRPTDFKKDDIVLNIKEGTLFYKSNKGLFRVQGDNINTTETEFLPDNIIKGNLTINGSSDIKEDLTVSGSLLPLGGDLIVSGSITTSGSLIPSITDFHDLGSATKQWNHLHVKNTSIKMYENGAEIGNVSYVSGSGLRVKDKEGNTKDIIGNVNGVAF